jgi:carbamoyltransferase
MANISFYGSHNSAIVIEENKKILEVIELERFLNQKNAGYAQYLTSFTRGYLIKYVLKYIEKKYGINHFDKCFYLNTDSIEGNEKTYYERLIPAYEYIFGLHHMSHAACGLYQSNFKNCIIISFDGGGNDGFFNLYHVPDRNTINLVESINLDLGFPYMVFGQYLEDIKLESTLSIGNLVYSGKIMGLCSYGNLRQDWLPHFEKFYKSKPDGNNYITLLNELGMLIDIKFDINNRLGGQLAWDIAKTSQIAFENVFIESTNKFISNYPNLPLILVGGCALNILLNTRLRNEFNRDIFVPPNPNDCGIASGLILNYLKPQEAVDLTYKGVGVLDEDLLMSYIESWWCKELDNDELLNDLIDGKIVGVVKGNSEHGPRALGNRSILCYPIFSEMKDILNRKVKNREWYRPFAPVVRLEDVDKYFNFSGESRWMSFCPTVKDKYREILKSITHVDGTARIQTVTREQNLWLYDLLTKLDQKTGIGVLLNTSFNVDGKPILSKYSDAIHVFESTQMDGLILNNFYRKK